MKKYIYIILFLNKIAFLQAQTVNVEWSNTQGSVPNQLMSLNIWDGTNPSVASDAAYQSAINDMSLSLVRYHAYEIVADGNPKCWVNYTTQKWKGTTVKTTLSALQGKVGGRVISIFNFPKWLCPDPNNLKYMPPSQANAFGDWCAALVDTVNNSSPYYSKYWEIFNELEDQYAGKTSELITIYNVAVTKMKAKDPNIKVGALSLTQPWWNPSEQEQFYAGVAANLDFVACHNYGMGSSNVVNTAIYKSAGDVAYYVGENMRNRMNAAGIASSVPIFLGETNISYAWNLDPAGKMASNVGAVYDAIVLKTAITEKKLASVQLFNDRDGYYGKLSGANAKRPAYEVLRLASKNLYGSFVKSLSTSEDSVQAVAVVNANGNHTIMLINRSLQNKSVAVNFTGSFAANGVIYTESNIKNTLTTQNLTWNGTSRTFTMPAESVTFWVFGQTTALPITLISFDGKNTPQGNLLSWKAAAMQNVSHFEIERSRDAVDFEKINTVKASQSNTYRCLDKDLAKNVDYYYRFKTVDNDGRFEKSTIIFISQKQNNITVSPNPTNGILNIETENYEQSFELINSLGQIVLKEKNLDKTLNVSFLEKGIYYLKINESSYKIVKE